MQGVLFYICFPFLYLVSYLPFPLLYLLSDITYVLFYKIIGYRKSVVINNLKNSFPDKSNKEIEQIAQEFYQHLCDIIFETFKKLSMTSKQASERCKIMSPEIFQNFYSKNQSIVLLMGHYGNWEWAGSSFTLLNMHQLRVIYRPLSNRYFENFLIKTRTLFGTKLIKEKETLKEIISLKESLSAFAFIADQTADTRTAIWLNFLSQVTGFTNGAAKIAQKYDYPIVFVNIIKVKRGYYEIHSEVLTEQPKTMSEVEIIKTFAQKIEKQIVLKPHTWLWSHKRWKHTKPTNANIN